MLKRFLKTRLRNHRAYMQEELMEAMRDVSNRLSMIHEEQVRLNDRIIHDFGGITQMIEAALLTIMLNNNETGTIPSGGEPAEPVTGTARDLN